MSNTKSNRFQAGNWWSHKFIFKWKCSVRKYIYKKKKTNFFEAYGYNKNGIWDKTKLEIIFIDKKLYIYGRRDESDRNLEQMRCSPIHRFPLENNNLKNDI